MSFFVSTVNWSILYDMLPLVIIFAVALSYCKRGFLSSLVNLMGNIISLGGAVYVSQRLSDPVFELVFGTSVVEKISKAITAGEADLAKVLETYVGFLPVSIRQTILEKLESAIRLDGVAAAQRVVTEVLQPLVAPILALAIFFLVYFLLRLAVLMVRNLFQAANHVPLFGTLNRVMGCVLGVAAGLLDVYLLFCVCYAATVITNNSLVWLNLNVLEGSGCFRIFQQLNPFI